MKASLNVAAVVAVLFLVGCPVFAIVGTVVVAVAVSLAELILSIR